MVVVSISGAPAPVSAREDDPSEPPAGARTTRVSSILTPPLPGK